MPITNYSVLVGDPVSGKVVTGSSTHYQITVQAKGGPFTVAVNIQSVDGSEVLYDIVEDFTPPDEAGGLALDYVRSMVNGRAMITKAQMTLLPQANAKAKGGSEEERMLQRARTKALENAV